jgi:hypothetical protein
LQNKNSTDESKFILINKTIHYEYRKNITNGLQATLDNAKRMGNKAPEQIKEYTLKNCFVTSKCGYKR